MNIAIKDGLAEVQYNKGKKNYTKSITIDSLASAFVSEYGLRSPLLPFGTRFYANKGERHTLLLEFPEMVRNIKYVNGAPKTIYEGPMATPWGCFYLEMIDKGGHFEYTSFKIFALEKPLLSLQDRAYHWPMSNVFQDGGICWGYDQNQEVMKPKSLMQASQLIDYFFSGNFNTDVHPRINKYSRWEDYLRENRESKKFDYSCLSVLRSHVSEFIK